MLGTLKATEADLTTKAVDVSRIKDLLRSNEVEIQKWAIKYQQVPSSYPKPLPWPLPWSQPQPQPRCHITSPWLTSNW